MTTYYVDTSVAVHAFVGTPAATRWFDEVTARSSTTIVSSRILQIELTRFLRREGLPVARRSEILDVVAQIELTEGILAVAESIPDHVRTLDAIHVASALAVGAQTVVVSHDARLSGTASGAGLAVLDPLD